MGMVQFPPDRDGETPPKVRELPPPADRAVHRPVHQVVIGDARSMRRIESRTVHLVVTSPPYWQLKD